MAGVKGRSGRRPLSVEAKRLMVIDKAWAVTEHALDSKEIQLIDRAHIAIPLVRSDMAKPILIDASTHTHLTTINVENMQDAELVDFLTGRKKLNA